MARPTYRFAVNAAVFVLLAVMAAGSGFAASDASIENRSLRFDAGEFVLSDSLTPPPANAAWTAVTLTDLWRNSHPGASGRGWYRFTFTLDAVPNERWGVYLPGLASNAAAFMNGERVGDGGRMQAPVTMNSNRPLFFPVSPRALHEGVNHLDVALFAYPDSWDRLEPLWVGPAAELEPRFLRQHLWHVDVARSATGLVLSLLLFIGAIWLGSGREPVYGWLLVAAAFWSIVSFNYHIRELPISFHAWERLVHFSTAAAAGAGLMLAMRLVDIERSKYERILMVALAAVGGVLLLTPIGWLQDTARVVHIGSLGLLITIVVIVGRHRRLLQQAELPIFLAGTAGFLLIAGHDLSIQFGARAMDAPRLLPLGGPLLLMMFAGSLTARFVRATGRVSRMNIELEERVSQTEHALARSYRRMSELEKERALADERARILREVHDGMGGKIVSSLALLETGAAPNEHIAETLRYSLDDMRLLMHTLHPDAGDLDALLGMLRDRLETRLQGTGVSIEWKPGDLPFAVPLSPEQGHNIGRIVEEAFTNVIKHAGASRVRVSTEIVQRDGRSQVVVSVRDNGRAVSAPATPGHGVRNMQERAEASGGFVEVEHRDEGTEVRLWLPAAEDV